MLRRGIGLLLLLILLMMGSASAQTEIPAPGELYTVNGRQMHLNCTGDGDVTVVLEAGVGGFSLNWSQVQPELSNFARVCSYDRLGYGWSDPLPGDFNMSAAVDDLQALLEAADVEPPYVFVGHSFGGVIARSYTQAYPDTVQGMVFVDAVHPDLVDRIPFYAEALDIQLNGLALLSGVVRLRTVEQGNSAVAAPDTLPDDLSDAYTEKLLEEKFFETTTAEANYLMGDLTALTLPMLGDMPLVVLAHGISERNSFLGAPLNPTLAAEAEATWQQLQRELAALSTVGVYRVAEESGHNIQFEQPTLVIEAVREVIAAAD